MGFLKPTISDIDFYRLIEESIKNNKPLSMSRFGDGEIAFLNRDVPLSLKKRFCTEWGYTMKNYQEGEDLIYEILIDAIKNIDYFGVMDLNSAVSKRIKANNYNWGVNADLVGKFRDLNKINAVDHQITRGPLFGDILKFKEILNGNDLHIVSSRSNDLKKNGIDKILGANVTFTQVDYKTPLRDHDKVVDKVKGIKENVVLLSLGILGKDIPHKIVGNTDKICLDYGATIDAWAGIISRPWFNKGGLQNHCLIN